MNEPQEGISPSDVALMNTGDAGGTPPENTPINQYETRGFEVAQLQADGSWRRVNTYRDTELARKQCITDAKWFNSRGHKGVYQARVLVSCEMPREEDLNAPLVLDADESPDGSDIPQEVIEAMINEVELEAAERDPEAEYAQAEEERATAGLERFCDPDALSTPSSELGGEG